MGTITTTDGTEIFYKDWGSGQPIVFSHGWPPSGDDWDTQMLFFLQHGYRVIAHDRRGHGRSTQTADGHDMDHYADDLAALTAHLDLKNAIHIGHSTGGGEVTRYLARHRGLFPNGFPGGSQEDQRSGPGDAQRGRSDRALCRRRSALRSVAQERNFYKLQELPARYAHHGSRHDQRRPAGVHHNRRDGRGLNTFP